jgi:UDP-N-acetylmuramoyl-tripeptide--D-alanyl-D-alanine ligase
MSTPIPDNDAELTAWEVAAATRGRAVRLRRAGGPAVGFVTDSRAVRPGNAFVAIVGASQDGHRFLADAIARRASLVVVRQGTRVSETHDLDVVEVEDTLVAWGELARAHLRRWRLSSPRTATLAITGSTGKTTTKELTAALLSACGPCHATAGNLNNRVGVPAVALGVGARTRFAVFELGMSERGEIATLAGIVEPSVAVLLNVGVAHAGGVGGSRDDVAREKGALFEALGAGATAVVNVDDDAAAAQVARTRANVRTFGKHAAADYRLAGRSSLGTDGSRLSIERAGQRLEVSLPLLGEGAALDFLAALAAAEAALGEAIGEATVQQALASCRPVPGRARLTRLGDDILAIDDTYNANPSSMRAAIETLLELGASGRRKVAVLGEMRELGDIALSEHEALGDALARAGVALAIGCGGLMDRTLDRAEAQGVSVVRATTTEEAQAHAVREIRPGDVVLFKGSRTVGVERILRAVHEKHGSA